MTIYKGKFEQTLTVLLSRLISNIDKETTLKLTIIKDEMIGPKKGQVVKINHSDVNGTIVQKKWI
jgi:hypothetical protein